MLCQKVCRKHALAAGFVIFLAFYVRLVHPMLVEFSFDEALTTHLALWIAHEGYRPVVGVEASIGVYQFPHFLYLAAIPLKWWPHPLALVLFIAGLNALTVPVTYVLARRYWGPRAAWVAALLMAVNAWAVLYARKIWTQNVTLFTALFFAAVLLLVVERRAWALVPAWVGVAVLIGLHIEGLAFLVVLVLVLLLWRREVRPLPLAAGLLLAAALLAPYFIADARHGWPNVRQFWQYGRDPAIVTFHALDFAFRLASGRDLHALAGASAPRFQAMLPSLGFLNRGMEGLLALALVFAFWRVWRGTPRERRLFGVLLLWFWVPVLLQTRHTRPVYPHYFTILYPAPYLLIAGLIAYADAQARRWPRWRRWGRVAFLSGVIAWAVWQIVGVHAVWTFVDRYPTPGGFGVPLKYHEAAAQAAKALAAGKAEIIVMDEDAEKEWNVTRLRFDDLLFTHERRFVDGLSTVLIPARPAVYLVGPLRPAADPMTPTVAFLQALPHVRQQATVEMPNHQRYLLLDREADPFALPASFTAWTPPVALANGAVLLGYRLEVAPQPALWLAWRVDTPSGGLYRIFVHVHDAQGHTLGLGDASAMLPYYWREGDHIFTRVALPALPPEATTLVVGMYTLPNMERVAVVSPAPLAGRDHLRVPVSRP